MNVSQELGVAIASGSFSLMAFSGQKQKVQSNPSESNQNPI